MNEFVYIEVRPWPRFFARLLDYMITISLVLFSLDKLFKIQPDFPYSYLYYLLSLFLWVFAEALLLSVLGTTPGKWLLNIVVRDEQGKKLRFPSALKRSILVWLYGLWAGIAFANFFWLIQYPGLSAAGLCGMQPDL